MKTLFSVILGLLASAWQSLSPLTRWAFTSARGAYDIVNRSFSAFPSSFLPSTASTATVPGPSVTFADLTMVSGTVTSSTINTGIVGLKWVRVRALLKGLTGVSAGDTVEVTVRAGTGAALTGPGTIAQAQAIMSTGDTYITLLGMGWSNSGFQSYAVTVSTPGATSATAVADVEVSVA